MRTKALLMDYNNGYKSSATCPLCDGHVYQGDPCGNCYAPAGVIESIVTSERPPRFIGVLGPTGVGKTVYLGMLLDMLARGVGGLHGMARGPFSLSLHRNLILALEHQRFPDKTPNEPDHWQWVHCEVSSGRRGKVYDIVTPDVAGEAVQSELENPKSNKIIRALIGKCSALVVLVDILQVIGDGQGQELFAMQLISYLDSLQSVRRNRKVAIPVAIVFTKADLCEDAIDNAELFARSNAPALARICESRLKNYKFYCSAVAGSTAKLVDAYGTETLVPLRIEPRGIIEPFAWLMTQLR
jgi:Double-GTPase 2